MPPKGILGLAGGSLIFVILALAYLFTDRGREVGDRLGRSASERIDRLFPDEAGTGEGGGTEPEGVFAPEDPPEIADPAPAAPPITEPVGLPAGGGGGQAAPTIIPETAQTRQSALEAALAELNTQTRAGAIIPAVPIGNSRGIAAQTIYQNSRTPGNFGEGLYTQTITSDRSYSGPSVQSVLDTPSLSGSTLRERLQSGTATISPQYAARLGYTGPGVVASSSGSDDSTPTSAQMQAEAPTTTTTTFTSSRARNAFNRGRQLATQRQTVSPSHTRPPLNSLTPEGVAAAAAGFASGSVKSPRGL